MNAHETILQPVLEGTKQYVIPLFQRPYSWKTDDWKTLWEDLLSVYSSENSRKHFLGTLVSMPVEMTPAGVNKYLLIDGQQRVTTLFLILAAIRDLSVLLGDKKLAEQINESYLINKWAEGTNLLKLYPSQSDRDDFSRIMHHKDTVDSSSNVVKAFRFFMNKLQGTDLSGLPINLQKMHQTLVQEIMVVNIVLDNDENPYLIFESLNAKGEPLTQADLVRNYLLMRIKDTAEQAVAYQDFWLPMQEVLGNELTNYIWRYIVKDANSAKVIRLDEIYDEIKARLTKANPSEVIDLLMDMCTFSGYYLILLEPEKYEPNKEIARRLSRLNRWDVKTTYPLLLNICRDYKKNKISAEVFCEALDILESYVVRRAFCRYPTNALNKNFTGLYKNIEIADLKKSITNYLLKRDWPSDHTFLDAWNKFPIYLSGTSKCRLVLESLEEKLTVNKEPVDLLNSKISIEHIMPQTLNEEWEQLLGENVADIHERYLHTIGNLTLTGRNSDMGNKPLLEKKEVFKESNFALNKDLAELIIWSEQLIEQRAKKLGKLAVQIWKHPGGTEELDIDGTAIKDPTGKKPTGFSLYGVEHKVDNWRAMLVTALGGIAFKHSDKFDIIAVQMKTNKRTHISRQPNNMNTPAKIPGSNLWVEANQSSRRILWIISQTIELMGDKEDVFEAYW